MASLKCFVAMAFGHPDTDAFYRLSLKPVLREIVGTVPIRVDESDKNDPIDEQIYSLLNSSDLCLADLTYARPSVYYEAGYARGQGKPVIFTCRSDHFTRLRENTDLVEHLRVHFDLEQESILGWRDQSDSAFQIRLRRRLHTVLKPILRRLETDQALHAAEVAFASLPLREQRQRCYKIITEHLEQLGFKLYYPPEGGRFEHGLRRCRGELQGVSIIGLPNFDRWVVNMINMPQWLHPRYPRRNIQNSGIKRLFIVVKTDRLITNRRLLSLLPHFAPLATDSTFIRAGENGTPPLELLLLKHPRSEQALKQQLDSWMSPRARVPG